jgi:hypothetical protein
MTKSGNPIIFIVWLIHYLLLFLAIIGVFVFFLSELVMGFAFNFFICFLLVIHYLLVSFYLRAKYIKIKKANNINKWAVVLDSNNTGFKSIYNPINIRITMTKSLTRINKYTLVITMFILVLNFFMQVYIILKYGHIDFLFFLVFTIPGILISWYLITNSHKWLNKVTLKFQNVKYFDEPFVDTNEWIIKQFYKTLEFIKPKNLFPWIKEKYKNIKKQI